MGRLYGFGGKLRSGKDTVADYLVEKHGYVKIGMSDPLHTAIYQLNPLVHEGYHKDILEDRTWTYREATDDYGYTKAKELFPEYRRLLQVFGTEVMRDMFGENVWVDIADARIKDLQARGKSVVLTGIRFPNEFDLIHTNGGETVWVERPNLIEPVKLGQHASETSLSGIDFDVTLVNEGSLEDLFELTETVLV